MPEIYFTDREFKGLTSDTFESGEYESCRFVECDLNGADLSHSRFEDVEFVDSNLSNCILDKTAMQDLTSTNCKMLGLQWETVNALGFSVNFNQCTLDYSTFFELDLRQCTFDNCTMHGVDLAGCNLREVRMQYCDLKEAIFDSTDLRKADLRHSFGFQLNPSLNKITQMQISREELGALLANYQLNVE